jgi:hypothetical protein
MGLSDLLMAGCGREELPDRPVINSQHDVTFSRWVAPGRRPVFLYLPEDYEFVETALGRVVGSDHQPPAGSGLQRDSGFTAQFGIDLRLD